jgi:hypothetical protein
VAAFNSECSQQFRFRSHDANFGIRDLDAQRQCAQVIPPTAASLKPQSVKSNIGETLKHTRR